MEVQIQIQQFLNDHKWMERVLYIVYICVQKESRTSQHVCLKNIILSLL